MKRWAWGVGGILLLGVLTTAVVFVVWASVGDAPWEKTTAPVHCASPGPALSQEEAEKVACLQGGGAWVYFDTSNAYHENFCGPALTAGSREPCWACFHVVR
jgi:hypothetical protein